MRLRSAPLLAGLALVGAGWAAASDPPPAGVFDAPALAAVPARATNQCRLAQAGAHVALLCPAALPQATLPGLGRPAGTPPPALEAERAAYFDRGGRDVRLTFGYGAAWEPDSGPGWRQHLWRNRPCCFLHFEVLARVHRPFQIVGGRPLVLAGHSGTYLPAVARSIACGRAERAFWCNHVAFAWRRRGVYYAATLHDYGAGTLELLGRLVAQLRPAPR